MVNVCRLKLLIFISISCVLLSEFINSTPLQLSPALANQLANDQTKLSINNEHENKFFGNVEQNQKVNLEKSAIKDDDEDDDDKKDDKDEKDNKDVKSNTDDKDNKDNKDDKDDKDDKDEKDDKDGKDDKKGDTKEDDDKNVKDKNNTKEDNEDKKENEKKPEESIKKVDEKLDDNQKKKAKPEEKNFDDSSQEDDSHSNPDTEEEGKSESESDEDDKIEENQPSKGKLEKKLLIILASGFRYDYIHIQKLETIKDILKTGTTAKVKPAFPSNSYPNYYALMTGLHPAKNGFIDDEMYDTKYKEEFSGKAISHKHWWNKVEPLWVTAMNNKIKVGTYWWRGACGITIKGRTPKNCLPYREKVSNSEFSKQLENITELFSENKLDLALLSYEEIEKMGTTFGPESHKLRKAVRNFDKILADLLKSIDEKELENKVNLVVVSDHGMISIGEKIDLEKFIDFNDIDKFVNSGTFAMILPEDKKEDYIFNLLRNAKIEGLNVYKKPDFPPKFKFDKTDTDELILPIILTTDKGYYIGKPSIETNEEDANDKDEAKKGNHGYHHVHVKEMNTVMFSTGPDFEKNHVVSTIDQVDLYNVFCKLLKIKPIKNDGNKEIVDDFLHSSSSEEHGDDDQDNDDDEDSGDVENGYAPNKKKNDNLPVYKSRWALRGNSNSITLNLSLQFIILIITLIKFL